MLKSLKPSANQQRQFPIRTLFSLDRFCDPAYVRLRIFQFRQLLTSFRFPLRPICPHLNRRPGTLTKLNATAQDPIGWIEPLSLHNIRANSRVSRPVDALASASLQIAKASPRLNSLANDIGMRKSAFIASVSNIASVAFIWARSSLSLSASRS